jgi:hypothetical protein
VQQSQVLENGRILGVIVQQVLRPLSSIDQQTTSAIAPAELFADHLLGYAHAIESCLTTVIEINGTSLLFRPRVDTQMRLT